MLVGSLTSNENLWVHGAMVECGFELFDSICIIFDLDLWSLGAAKPEFKSVALFHHFPGLM